MARTNEVDIVEEHIIDEHGFETRSGFSPLHTFRFRIPFVRSGCLVSRPPPTGDDFEHRLAERTKAEIK